MNKSGEKKNALPKFSKVPKKVSDQLKPYVEELLEKCTTKRIDWDDLGKIFAHLKTINELEKPYAPVFPERETQMDSFCTWCSENNAEFSAVTFKEIAEGNFGAVAEKDLSENEPFLSVPRKIMMSEVTARSSKLGPLIESDPILQHMPNLQLTLHLLMEALNPDSEWAPYIRILPSSFTTVSYFTLDEIKELKGSPVLDHVIKLVYSTARQYSYFWKLFKTNPTAKSLGIGPYFTYELYRWAVSVVMTRQNAVPSKDGSKHIIALVPLFDMLNHANGKLSTDYSLQKDMLMSYSSKSFKKGDEVYNFYGCRRNGEFFMHNGFVYPENENDAVEIKLGLGKCDPLLKLKTEVCKKRKIPLYGPFYIYKEGSISNELFQFSEVHVMNSEELTLYNEDLENIPEDVAVQVGNRAAIFLKDRIYLLLKTYKTTLEEDEDLLKSAVPESQNLHLIIQLRMCEKRILNEGYNACVGNI